ncbi:MAG: hypothetical protein H7124_04800 [Phycisphaerales bacterium]|nr:hypothetical protein [Hyphomonadaceae bacterium]
MFLRRSLAAARNNSAMTFTSMMALITTSMFMSVTGGGLQPHETRAVQSTFASWLGDSAAAAELERATPYSTARAVHLIPLLPINFAETTVAPQIFDDGLLGGPMIERARVFAVSNDGLIPIACADANSLCAAPDAVPAQAELEFAAVSLATLH